MLALIRFELRKLLAQRKSLMGLANILIVNALFSLGFYLRARHDANRPHEIAPEYMVGTFLHTLMYMQMILVPCVFLIFPMVLAVLGAHILAGEWEAGNLRLMLIRPVRRWQVLGAKFVALSVYGAAMMALLALLSYAAARIQLPARGIVLVPGFVFQLKGHYILTADQAPYRILLSYTLAVPMLMSVSAMALMFALTMRHYTSAAILTCTVYFSSYIIGTIDILSALHPYLPTRYWPFWKFALMTEIPWDTIGLYALWTGGYTLAFLLLGVAVFNLRDV